MKIRLPVVVILFLFLAGFGYAQQTPVKVDISKEKVTIKGEIFYLHSVEKQQTLYSIAKKYGTEVETIIKDNPSLASGLKEGDRIYIRSLNVEYQKSIQEPDKRVVTPEPSKKPEPPKQVQDSSIVKNIQAEHIVRWYESLYSISKKYGVSEEDIIKANSLLNKRLETRMVLKIPISGISLEVSGKMESDSLLKSQEKIEVTPEVQHKERRGRDIFSGSERKYVASLILPLNGNSEVKSEN